MNSSTRQLLLILCPGTTDRDAFQDSLPHSGEAINLNETAARFGLGVRCVASLDEAVSAIEQGTVVMAVLQPAKASEDLRPVVEPLTQRWPRLPLFVAGEDRARPAQAALRAGAWGYLSGSDEVEEFRAALDAMHQSSRPTPPAATEDLTLAAAERIAIERALDASAGNVKRAAKTLGIARATLYRKMARFGLRS